MISTFSGRNVIGFGLIVFVAAALVGPMLAAEQRAGTSQQVPSQAKVSELQKRKAAEAGYAQAQTSLGRGLDDYVAWLTKDGDLGWDAPASTPPAE